jgi:glycosyltransferase involved in cell wall biosynthesis
MNLMTTPPKISIITPSYNQAEFLESTINSVLDQQYPNLEYILIDGGSTDGSMEIIKKYQHHFSYWISEKDNGQSQAINKGFKLATGKYVNWLNSDDIFLKDALFTLAHYLESHPSIDIVFGNVLYINSNNEHLYRSYEIPYSQKITLYGTNHVLQPAALYKKSVIEKIGLLDERLHYTMDHEFWVRIHNAGFHFAGIQDAVAGYRLHNHSKGVSHMHDKIKRERRELKLKYGRKCKSLPIETMRLNVLNLFYRPLRKIRQFVMYQKVDLIPTAVKLRYFHFKKKLM